MGGIRRSAKSQNSDNKYEADVESAGNAFQIMLLAAQEEDASESNNLTVDLECSASYRFFPKMIRFVTSSDINP